MLVHTLNAVIQDLALHVFIKKEYHFHKNKTTNLIVAKPIKQFIARNLRLRYLNNFKKHRINCLHFRYINAHAILQILFYSFKVEARKTL